MPFIHIFFCSFAWIPMLSQKPSRYLFHFRLNSVLSHSCIYFSVFSMYNVNHTVIFIVNKLIHSFINRCSNSRCSAAFLLNPIILSQYLVDFNISSQLYIRTLKVLLGWANLDTSCLPRKCVFVCGGMLDIESIRVFFSILQVIHVNIPCLLNVFFSKNAT